MGSNEHRLPGSRAGFVRRLNAWLSEQSDAQGVELVALDARAAADGLGAWHDPALWHRSKQEISPAAAPVYGELVVRVLAALQGRSRKCLVLDLDNTIWGGVVGDDGVDGLVLGQGSALGEAFTAVQAYAKDLAARGVILAVCSKNDEANALEAFDRHPEMVLKRGDIACFAVNWSDKASNLRTIAAELNIGLDSLVFLDDNPAERELIRRELPMVAVPEVGEDPALYPRTIADAGYFESTGVTGDDRERNRNYRDNRLRDVARAQATDMPSYLKGLEMRMLWRPFDRLGLTRIVQLINKTNQFNLTTRRYTEKQVSDLMADPNALALQIRLIDTFGDNGVVAIVIGRLAGDALEIDTWLMSCRVLGRRVEAAMLNLIAEQALKIGAARLVGEYRPSAKNGIVRDHYRKLGFVETGADADGHTKSVRDLSDFAPLESFIVIEEG
jgi:FkbH-like protein